MSYSVTFTDTFLAASWYAPAAAAKEAHRKLDEALTDAGDRPIRCVRIDVDFADEVSERVGLEREGWDVPPEAA